MAVPFAKTILARLHAELKPRGFRKQGQTFLKPENDCWQIVNLRTSGFNGACSVHLGVYCTRLEPLPWDAMRLKEYDGHWRADLGEFLEDRRVRWRAGTDEDALTAESIVGALRLALVSMDAISSYDALIRIPLGVGATSDDPPGVCRGDLVNAAREREGLPARIELSHTEGWRNAWHRRQYPDYDPPAQPQPSFDPHIYINQVFQDSTHVSPLADDGVAPLASDDDQDGDRPFRSNLSR